MGLHEAGVSEGFCIGVLLGREDRLQQWAGLQFAVHCEQSGFAHHCVHTGAACSTAVLVH